MFRIPRSSWTITAFSALVALAACSGDDSSTGATTASTSDSSDSDTSSSSGTSSTSEATTTSAGTTTASSGETDTSSSTTDDSTSADPTTSTTDASTTEDTSTTDPTTTSGGDGVCGNGELEDGEVCDDGNLVTEAPGNLVKPHIYAEGQCIDNCGLVLPTCGDGKLDPGEQCDDGNQDSLDKCTTSCTNNEGSFHDPCFRLCNGKTCSANDVAAGEITGCEKIVAPAGALKICYESGNVKIQGIIDKKLYFAEGDCSISAQKCTGLFCPASATFGSYDAFNACPNGTTLVDRTTEEGGVKVQTKVCQKVCASDIECRWNAHDEFWKAPGRYRCQTTPDSKGVKICADAQNQ